MSPRKARCPECEQEFELEEEIQIEDITYCPDCDAELRVVKLNPPRVETVKTIYDESEQKEAKDDDYPEYF